ncbi:hypothetical protein SCHPADRAFT_909965 [Schizopora paradoxa]|uniref:GST N-terminal domain-containing protein n=1 Tax=Schizopora paradoxa TaxID=27342 RepID=A0A0H2R554_9AGAM|nr:hypothetical protein SCHPADRAFT_909965 [Schizopora paradoxa]
MITLYDIPANVPGGAFSPNTHKARLSIAFKGLQFKTEWVEMCDIEPKMKELGAQPTTTKPDGSPMYTLPVIYDDATGKYISDSMKISEYLEATYPDKPSLYPFEAHAPIRMFHEFFHSNAIKPAVLLITLAVLPKINAPSFDHIRRTREAIFGKTLEELTPKGDERTAQLASCKAGFSKLAEVYSSNGDGKPYFYGAVPSYADLIVAAYLLWIKASIGHESPEWKEISGEWDGGQWGELLNLLWKYNVAG